MFSHDIRLLKQLLAFAVFNLHPNSASKKELTKLFLILTSDFTTGGGL
jgi:hypothetical protein